MILDEQVKVKFKGNNKVSFYKNLGYNISSDDFYVSVKDLLPNSEVIVKAKCDFCEKVVFVKYKNYYRNFNRSSHNKYSCSKKCSNKKTEKTNLEKYGCRNPNSSNLIKEKKKKTNLERYGTEYTFENDVIKKKIKNTNLERYGVENPFSSKNIIEKIYKTNIKKYRTKNPASSDVIKDKIKNTNLEKYGNIYFFKTDKFIKNLEKYKYKIKQSYIESFGLDHPMKSDAFRYKFKICNDDKYLEYKGDSISIFKCDEGHTFEINSDNYRSRVINDITLCTKCYPIGEQNSIKEKELLNFIKSIYKGIIIQSYRDNLEIDIYLPELKLGFEFNGLYWHSEKYKDKNYHINKTKHFKNKGLRIIHIWEDDWTFKNEILKSQILNWIGISEKVFARKCFVKEVSKQESINFLNKNHIQGADISDIKIGLFYNSELISLMTFNKSEGRKKMYEYEWNLSRFCNKLNYSVVGGASKLLSFFIKNYKPKRIISYADKDWSDGGLYEKLGFIKTSDTKPDYKYILNKRRRHKSNFKKKNIGIKDINITESNFMNLNGFNKIWDCGKLKFELSI